MKKKTREPYEKPKMRAKKLNAFFFTCECAGAHGQTSCDATGSSNKKTGNCY